MEKFKKEIRILIRALEAGILNDNSIEPTVLVYLNQVLTQIESSGSIREGEKAIGELRQYWLTTVPWCSELSRDIEKIIIMYEDLTGC